MSSKPQMTQMAPMKRDEGEKETDAVPPRALGANTPVQLGIALTLLGSIVGAAWWASSVSTKLDEVLRQNSALIAKNDLLTKEIEDHKTEDRNKWAGIESRVLAMETVGLEGFTRRIQGRTSLRWIGTDTLTGEPPIKPRLERVLGTIESRAILLYSCRCIRRDGCFLMTWRGIQGARLTRQGLTALETHGRERFSDDNKRKCQTC